MARESIRSWNFCDSWWRTVCSSSAASTTDGMLFQCTMRKRAMVGAAHSSEKTRRCLTKVYPTPTLCLRPVTPGHTGRANPIAHGQHASGMLRMEITNDRHQDGGQG